jgi:tRNA(fMet)-specific endonuclease VapC
MRYLLDTNAAIAVINKSEGMVSQRVKMHEPGEIVISSIVLHELYFGAFKSIYEERSVGFVDRLSFGVVDFDREDARRAGQIRAYLSSLGTPIGPLDLLIAGQALQRKLIVITANTREFSRVSGLICEDWSR